MRMRVMALGAAVHGMIDAPTTRTRMEPSCELELSTSSASRRGASAYHSLGGCVLAWWTNERVFAIDR